ncbi:MAG TPA: hypothetical protein VK071_02000 [Tissierellales bacterium]|nr:hypothetical protein [Tissierellales bacterium]
MLLEMASVWLVAVPLVFEFLVHIVLALVALEEVVKAIISIPRLISKKWVRNVTDNM